MRVSFRVGVIAVVSSVFASAACFDYEEPVSANGDKPVDRPDTSRPDDTVTGPVTTWHEHVRPLVEKHCVSCHESGNSGAMPLDSYAATEGFRQRMVARVNHPLGQGDELPMPPWPFDPTCREVHDARLLSSVEKAVFTAWGTTGYSEGDPNRYVPPTLPPREDLGSPAVSLTRDEGYTPSRALPDDYRCFIYPQTFEQDRWVTAVDIVPDKPEVVHHVLLFVVSANEVARVTALDQAAAGPGYPCVGGSGARDDALIAGWVPGMRPIVFPPGSAFPIRAGSRLVAQMHYNTVNLGASPVPSDRTGASLWALTPGQIPFSEVRIRAVADLNLDIRKNDANAVEGISVRTPFSERAVGVIPHMHMLGKSLTLEVERPGNPARECLARIPLWDFHWQQTYMFTPAAQLDLHLGDQVHLRCVYDNSAANQAVVDGVRRDPEDVTWGEGSFDEMCLAYVVTTTPIYSDQRPDALCDGFTSCFAERCGDTDALCAVDCLSWVGLDCAQCAFLPIYDQCARSEGCIVPLAALGACINRCPQGMDTIECVLGTCGDDFQRLHVCLAPAIAAGACNDEAASCGIGTVAE